MELVLALIIFFALVVCWLVLPNSAPSTQALAVETEEPVKTTLSPAM